jgi:hypothetical protein
MVNYDNGKIYKIVCNVTGETYIGATTKKYVSKRLTEHVYRFNHPELNQYMSKKIIENGNYYIELVELVKCESKDELSKRERYWIENTVCVNKQMPSRTKKEYRELVRDKQIEYMKIYSKTNSAKLNQRASEWYKNNSEEYTCGCGSITCRARETRHFKSDKHKKYLDSTNAK